MAIVKSNLHANTGGLTNYIQTRAGNERVEIIFNQGSIFTALTPEHIWETSRQIDMAFQATKGKYSCYHVQISPGKDESYTTEQAVQAIKIWLEEHKLSERPAIGGIHYNPDGSMHVHVQVSRVGKDGKLDRNSMMRDGNDRVRYRLEKEFGHRYTPQRNERRSQIRAQVTDLYHSATTPREFVEGVNKMGYLLSYGGNKSHPWQLVDSKAVGHNMASLIHVHGEDGKSGKITNRALADYFRGQKFPTLKQALTLQQVKIRDYILQEKQAEKEAAKAEQFNYSPDSRKPKIRITASEQERLMEVAKTGPEKKPDTSRDEKQKSAAEKYQRMIDEMLRRNRERQR